MKTIESVKESFFQKVDTSNPDACWEWQTLRTKAGYGRVWANGGLLYTHRLAWEIANRKTIGPGLHVCHKCDNPPCCNPAHLFVGTAADNANDKMKKGRHKNGDTMYGESHKLSKLTEQDVRDIRANYRRGKPGTPSPYGAKALAKRYGVAHSLIWRIVKRQSWPHLV